MAKDRSTTKEKKGKKDKKDKKDKKTKDPIAPIADEKNRISKKKKGGKSKSDDVPTDDESIDAPQTVLSSLSAQAERRPDAEPMLILQTDSILVPFAKPLAGEKLSKKVFKTVKKASKNKSLKRGVKEVVKALRKSPTSGASGIVILAADISPMDVISHVPVLCEDHGIPYLFVRSRAELGAASSTKRPTSVAMVVPAVAGKGGDKKKRKKKNGEGEGMEGVEGEDADGNGDGDGFKEAYDELLSLVEAEGRGVMV